MLAAFLLTASTISWLVSIARKSHRTAKTELACALVSAANAYRTLLPFQLGLKVAQRGIIFTGDTVIELRRSTRASSFIGEMPIAILAAESDWFAANAYYVRQVAEARSAIAAVRRAVERLEAAVSTREKQLGSAAAPESDVDAAIHMMEHNRILVSRLERQLTAGEEARDLVEREIKRLRSSTAGEGRHG